MKKAKGKPAKCKRKLGDEDCQSHAYGASVLGLSSVKSQESPCACERLPLESTVAGVTEAASHDNDQHRWVYSRGEGQVCEKCLKFRKQAGTAGGQCPGYSSQLAKIAQ